MRRHLLNILVVFGLLSPALGLAQQTAQEYFQQNCASCHTIGGGRLVGPDLKNVTDKKDRQWLVTFMQNPQKMINSGDAYAQQLQKEARGVVMPTLPTMTPARANSLLDFIEQESGKSQSSFAGSQASNQPLTPADQQKGRQIFLGYAALQNGGPACISCHTVNGEKGLLGGGTLAPNLTNVTARLGGQQGLSAWLSAPATPTMSATFQKTPLTQEEITALVAYFLNQAQQNPPPRTAPFVNYLLFGLGGTVLLLVAFDFFWGHRFRGVRKPLVEKSRKQQHVTG